MTYNELRVAQRHLLVWRAFCLLNKQPLGSCFHMQYREAKRVAKAFNGWMAV